MKQIGNETTVHLVSNASAAYIIYPVQYKPKMYLCKD